MKSKQEKIIDESHDLILRKPNIDDLNYKDIGVIKIALKYFIINYEGPDNRAIDAEQTLAKIRSVER